MALTILKTGISITTSGTSAGATLPTSSSGAVALYIRIAVTVAAYVRIGTGAQTAVTTDMMLIPGDSVVVATNGNTHIAAIQVAAAGVVQVSPVDGL
jgi:hypothetical protein